MNVQEFQTKCMAIAKDHHRAYMKWLDTQDFTKAKPSDEFISKPNDPILEITREQESDLKFNDRDGMLFNWHSEKLPTTLDEREFYGVKIKVKDE